MKFGSLKDQLGYRAIYDRTTMDSKRTRCEISIRLSWLRIKSSDTFLDNSVGKLPGVMEDGEFLDYVSHYQLLKDSDPWI
jgi:hypothetical protein